MDGRRRITTTEDVEGNCTQTIVEKKNTMDNPSDSVVSFQFRLNLYI